MKQTLEKQRTGRWQKTAVAGLFAANGVLLTLGVAYEAGQVAGYHRNAELAGENADLARASGRTAEARQWDQQAADSQADYDRMAGPVLGVIDHVQERASEAASYGNEMLLTYGLGSLSMYAYRRWRQQEEALELVAPHSEA